MDNPLNIIFFVLLDVFTIFINLLLTNFNLEVKNVSLSAILLQNKEGACIIMHHKNSLPPEMSFYLRIFSLSKFLSYLLTIE